MGQLFTRISTGWFDEQTSTALTSNNFVPIKPMITKRKRLDQDILSKKRKIFINDNNENDHLLFSSRISRISKSSNLTNTSIMNDSLSRMILFKCQLCCRCFSSKDCYLDHMIICAIEHQASIKIIRARKPYSI